MYPEAQPTIGPPIDNGFYYDFNMDPIGDEDLKRIEKKMQEHVRSNHVLIREEHDRNNLKEMFSQNPFKLEIIDDKLGDDAGSSVYRQGDFVDLCLGPHVPSTSFLRWFKLTSTSQAYWKGDKTRGSLVRIYGMCYHTKDELRERGNVR